VGIFAPKFTLSDVWRLGLLLGGIRKVDRKKSVQDTQSLTRSNSSYVHWVDVDMLLICISSPRFIDRAAIFTAVRSGRRTPATQQNDDYWRIMP